MQHTCLWILQENTFVWIKLVCIFCISNKKRNKKKARTLRIHLSSLWAKPRISHNPRSAPALIISGVKKGHLLRMCFMCL